MPTPSTNSGQQQRLVIQDFTAGIRCGDYDIANVPAQASLVPSINQVSFSRNTYGVTGLIDGGLLLGPQYSTLTTFGTSFPTGMLNPIITGYIRTYDSGQIVNYFTVFGVNSSNVTMWAVYSTSGMAGPVTNGTIAGPVATSGAYASYAQATTLSNGTNFTEAMIFTPWGFGTMAVYGSGTTTISTQMSAQYGFPVVANGRVWQFCDPPILTLIPGGAQLYNAVIYNAPTTSATASNLTMPNASTGTMIDYDNPSNPGAWGLMTTAEMMVVKQSGGGIIVTGDIFNPTVSKAPAIMGTNGYINNSTVTPIGLVYRSQNAGIWAWDGSLSSRQISQYVDDQFFPTSGLLPGVGQFTTQLYFDFRLIRNFIFTTGGLFYDMNTSAWWRLPPYLNSVGNQPVPGKIEFVFDQPGAGDICTFVAGPNSFYQINWSFSGGSTAQAPGPPLPYHSYAETNPIIIQSYDIVEVQEIDVVIQGYGNLTVTVAGPGGVANITAPRTVLVNSPGFTRIRINTQFVTDQVVLRLGWASLGRSGTESPIIAEIDILYNERMPAGQAR